MAKISKDAPLEKVCLLGCALPQVGCSNQYSKSKTGDTVAVFGLGGIGLAVIMAANTVGASRIIAIEFKP